MTPLQTKEKTGNVVKQFFLDSFRRMDRESIAFVVLRSVEEINNPLPGKDVDIVVNKKDSVRLVGIFEDVCGNLGGHLIFRRKGFMRKQFLFLFVVNENDPVALSIDLMEKIDYCGMDLIPVETLLNSRKRFEDAWRPSSANETAAILFHAVLDKGRFRVGIFDRIVHLYDQDRDGFLTVLRTPLCEEEVQWVEDCINRRRFEDLLNRKRWLASLFRKHPIKRILYYRWKANHTFQRLGLIFRRRGALIAVLGPDGTGKSTLVGALSQRLRNLPIKIIEYYFGVRTPFLPTKRILRKMHENKRQNSIERDSAPSGHLNERERWAYFLGAIHTLLDQILRYWVFVYFPLAQRKIVVCDRYPYDAVTIPSPAGFHFILKIIITVFVPKPDLTVIMEDDARKIFSRKPELKIPEIERQQKCYGQLYRPPFQAKQYKVIGSPEVMARRIFLDVMGVFRERNV